MNVYEMEGFLRGKCLPSDIKVNESNAEYLVRQLNAASELEGEVTALVATLEKCREVSGCPEGVDLQDHLRQMAAENMALKEACGGNGSYRNCPACTFSEYIEAPETPATDAYLAGIKADGVEQAANECYGGGYICETLLAYAKQLREGADK
ncbi:TPA: hypothetical protein ACQJMR_004089 [Raoultella ornithinolytica]